MNSIYNEPKSPMNFLDCVQHCLSIEPLVKEFDRLWGHNLSDRGKRSPIEKMIDTACDYDPYEKAMLDFMGFVDKYVWSTLPDEYFRDMTDDEIGEMYGGGKCIQ